ncbi:MAG: recombinase family protein [archaeon]|nr:recombinase family protein [archaeon]
MAKKCILLVRVSTKKQDFTEQEKECYNLALKDGYTPSNIIIISEKESGVKLSEEERAGLTKMKQYIETDSAIDCVYSWEVSRIARRKKISFSILDYLKEHNVNLKINKPSLTLLDKDGNEIIGMSIAFSIFATMAELEAEMLKERVKRTFKKLKEENKYIGGNIPFGMMVNEQRELTLDPTVAPDVRDIFYLHAKGWSFKRIEKEMSDRGYKLTRHTIERVIKGENYKQYVDEETWNKCQEVTEQNKTFDRNKQHANIYYCKGIVRCPECGKVLWTHTSQLQYMCRECSNTKSYSINIVDSLTWYVSKIFYIGEQVNLKKEQKENALKKRDIIEKKIETVSKNLNIKNKKYSSLEEDYYVNDKIKDYTVFTNLKEKLLSQIENLKQELNLLNKQNALISKQINSELNKSYNINDFDVLTEIQKQEICQSMIEKVYCYSTEKRTIINVSIFPKNFNKPIIFEINPYTHKATTTDIILKDDWYKPHLTTKRKGRN